MAHPRHQTVANEGAASLNAWRGRHPGVPLDLTKAPLANARLAGADLSAANLADADLSRADLAQANLADASLVRARLDKAEMPGATFTRADMRKARLTETNLTGADLRNADLAEADLTKANLRAASATRANLQGALLANAELDGARLDDTDLRGAVLRHAILTGADLSRAQLADADLKEAVLSGAILAGVKFHGEGGAAAVIDGDAPHPDLSGANLRRVDLSGTDLRGVRLRGADLRDAKLIGANLNGVDLRDAELGGADLAECDLRDANLLGANVDSETILRRARVTDCKVDRGTLESLKDYGGLTAGDRMRMDIMDGVSTMRSYYSGFWQWIHLIALLLFIFPYVWFAFSRWTTAQWGAIPLDKLMGLPFGGFGGGGDPEPVQTIQLWEALLRYIWNGGEQWKDGWHLNAFQFSLFMFSSIYNGLRLIMLWKTKMLELQQETTGLPVPFSTLGWWGRGMVLGKTLFYVNLAVVLMHSWHFLQQPIPV